MGWSEAASPGRWKPCRQPWCSVVYVLGVLWHVRAALLKISGQVRSAGPGRGVAVCWHAQLLSSSAPQSSHLKSQPTKVWPFPAPQQEFLQRHVNNSKPCFTLFSALKCSSISQIFCVNKGKSLWTWQGFYFYFILCIKSLLLQDINLYSEANVFMKHTVNHMHKLGTTS